MSSDHLVTPQKSSARMVRVVLTISPANFDETALLVFLQDHLDDLSPTAPAESRHALDLTALKQPDVRLWVAHDDGALVGTAALATLVEPGHEELKSMRTEPMRRGSGIASAMLLHLLGDARARGIDRISLETGSMEFFAPARALYGKHGFVDCAFRRLRRGPEQHIHDLDTLRRSQRHGRATAPEQPRLKGLLLYVSAGVRPGSCAYQNLLAVVVGSEAGIRASPEPCGWRCDAPA
jgi:putative acetyltransferase